jgi:hypothetical protein
MKPKINRSSGASSKYDCCGTPFYGVMPLLPYLPPAALIWEPAAGEGLMAGVLRTRFPVVATDILGGVDFFDSEPARWDVLVTNPPYTLKYQWLERCYLLGKPFALLMPVEVLGASRAQNLFQRYGVEILFLNRRVDFKMPVRGYDGSGAQFPVAWFTYGLRIGREMTFCNVSKPKRVKRKDVVSNGRV